MTFFSVRCLIINRAPDTVVLLANPAKALSKWLGHAARARWSITQLSYLWLAVRAALCFVCAKDAADATTTSPSSHFLFVSACDKPRLHHNTTRSLCCTVSLSRKLPRRRASQLGAAKLPECRGSPNQPQGPARRLAPARAAVAQDSHA